MDRHGRDHAPGDIDKEIKNYAEIMISALKEKKLI